MDDKKIIEMLWARLESALSALAEKYGRRLLCTARNILGNSQDAEEAVNDTYLALWNLIPPEQPDPLSAYVCRVGKNIALKQLRSTTAQKRDNRYDLSLDELSDILPGDHLEDSLNACALGQAIRKGLEKLGVTDVFPLQMPISPRSTSKYLPIPKRRSSLYLPPLSTRQSGCRLMRKVQKLRPMWRFLWQVIQCRQTKPLTLFWTGLSFL